MVPSTRRARAPHPGLRCIKCGAARPTRHVSFRQNVGALIMRFSKEIDGPLCGPCIDSVFWSWSLVTFIVGWWGVISLVLTPIFLINNLVNYAKAGSVGKSFNRAWIVLGLLGIAALPVVYLATRPPRERTTPAASPRPGPAPGSASRPSPVPRPTLRLTEAEFQPLHTEGSPSSFLDPASRPKVATFLRLIEEHSPQGAVAISMSFEGRLDVVDPPSDGFVILGKPSVLPVGAALAGGAVQADLERAALESLQGILAHELGRPALTVVKGERQAGKLHLALSYRIARTNLVYVAGEPQTWRSGDITVKGYMSALAGLRVEAELSLHSAKSADTIVVLRCTGEPAKSLETTGGLLGDATAAADYPLLARSAMANAVGTLRGRLPAVEIPATTEEYEVVATLVRFLRLSQVEGAVLLTDDPDPRWCAEFELQTIIRGTSPSLAGSSLRYAIHSPEKRGLHDREGGRFRIIGRLTGGIPRVRHSIAVKPEP